MIGGEKLVGGRGSSNPGGSNAKATETINRLRTDWEDMAKVDMGTSINPVVREVNDLINTVQAGFDEGEKITSFQFEKRGELIKYLNGYQVNSGDYDNVQISQTLDLHSVAMTKRGLAGFLSFLDTGRFKGYGDYARSELQAASRRGRRKK